MGQSLLLFQFQIPKYLWDRTICLGKGSKGCSKNLNFLLVVKKWDALKDSVQDENMLNFNSRHRLLPTVTTSQYPCHT